MRFIEEDFRVWSQEDIDNQNALSSIAKELKKLYDENDVTYDSIDFDIFDYDMNIIVRNVPEDDKDMSIDIIESDLGYPVEEKGDDLIIDVSQQYEDENGDINTRVSREYLDECLTENYIDKYVITYEKNGRRFFWNGVLNIEDAELYTKSEAENKLAKIVEETKAAIADYNDKIAQDKDNSHSLYSDFIDEYKELMDTAKIKKVNVSVDLSESGKKASFAIPTDKMDESTSKKDITYYIKKIKKQVRDELEYGEASFDLDDKEEFKKITIEDFPELAGDDKVIDTLWDTYLDEVQNYSLDESKTCIKSNAGDVQKGVEFFNSTTQSISEDITKDKLTKEYIEEILKDYPNSIYLEETDEINSSNAHEIADIAERLGLDRDDYSYDITGYYIDIDNLRDAVKEDFKSDMDKLDSREINIGDALINIDMEDPDTLGYLSSIYDMVKYDLTDNEKLDLVNAINDHDLDKIESLLTNKQRQIDRNYTAIELETIEKPDDIIIEDLEEVETNVEDIKKEFARTPQEKENFDRLSADDKDFLAFIKDMKDFSSDLDLDKDMNDRLSNILSKIKENR